MKLNERQRKYLASDLARNRVNKRSQGGREFSYLEAWDVRRTLIRVFGYGGFSTEVLDATCVVDRPTTTSRGKEAFEVVYLVRLRLTLHDADDPAIYTEVATGSAILPDLGQAHDMAVKTAESDALKRCAVNLGTQFGLSLYEDGSHSDVVKWTLDHVDVPEGHEDAPVTPETPVAAPEPPSEAAAAGPEDAPDPNVGMDQDALLADLRAVYGLDTAAQKVQRVAEIKGTCDTATLNTLVTIQGTEMTIERLMDKIVSDALAKPVTS